MPEKWTIQEATVKQVGNSQCWRVRMLKADGKPHLHTMPAATLDWRAAEYGIDPSDVDALLEIVLHEPFLAMADDSEDHHPRYADDGPTLWDADNTTTAREAHLARVKNSPVRINVRNVPALDVIRNGHRPDPDRLRAMRELVDTHRWINRYGDLPARPKPTPKAALEVPRA